jgi:hypothetical protein
MLKALAIALVLAIVGAAARSGVSSVATAAEATGTLSHSADAFLSSLGINIHTDQGYPPQSYIEPLKYLGVRAVRTGAGRVAGAVYVARRTGVLVGIFANGGPVDSFMSAARQLVAANALLALEGPNEPNNFPITYDGKRGGGAGTWLPVAEFQRDVYAAVRADTVLRNFPVFSTSEPGAQTDNVGLQFLAIPEGAETLLAPGTSFADFANVHNYVIGNGAKYEDNQAWNASDPTLNDRWDGLYGNFGVTWGKGFKGYVKEALATLPRVTTETGWDSVKSPGGERTQGAVLVNTYLAQYKRGYRYTFIYQLRDGEGGQDHFGVFDKDSRPKLSATYIHNLTAILADRTPIAHPDRLNYSIPNQPTTVHDLLLQKSDGTFALAVWGEKVTGTDDVEIDLGGVRGYVKVFDVTKGTEPIATLRNAKSVRVSLSDHALIVEIGK